MNIYWPHIEDKQTYESDRDYRTTQGNLAITFFETYLKKTILSFYYLIHNKI